MTRVAVTGADGFVGSSVVAALERRGISVVRIVRRRTRTSDLTYDLCDPSSISSLVEHFVEIDALVHVAAHVHRPIETPAERRLFRTVNVDGTARLVDAAAQAGVARVVYASTIGVYDFADGIAKEETEPNPSSAYATTKLEGEAAVRERIANATVARLATVYGAGDRANFARLARAVRGHRFVIPGDGTAKKSVISVTDAGESFAELAIRRDSPTLVHLASPYPLSIDACCTSLAKALGVMAPLHAPLAALGIAGRIGDGLRALGVRTPFDSSVLTKLTSDSVVDTSRLLAWMPDHRFSRFEDDVARAYGGIR